MKYELEYRYDWWELGCGCCSDSETSLTVRATDSSMPLHILNNVGLHSNEEELREWVEHNLPQYADFSVHPDTEWF